MNRSKAIVDQDLCSGIGCRVCLYVCPRQCISMTAASEEFTHQQVAQVDAASCTGCALCEKSCFKGAIRVNRD